MTPRLPIVALAAVLASCSSLSSNAPPNPSDAEAVFAGGEASLSVAIADTAEERALGLMWVRSLPEDQGMAFVWDTPEDDSYFWMMNTLIPLSIAFVGDDDRIVTIREMAPCVASPCTHYVADAPYVLAVEANAGWFERNGIEVGDTAELVMNDDR